jgi:hypothetical protein
VGDTRLQKGLLLLGNFGIGVDLPQRPSGAVRCAAARLAMLLNGTISLVLFLLDSYLVSRVLCFPFAFLEAVTGSLLYIVACKLFR